MLCGLCSIHAGNVQLNPIMTKYHKTHIKKHSVETRPIILFPEIPMSVKTKQIWRIIPNYRLKKCNPPLQDNNLWFRYPILEGKDFKRYIQLQIIDKMANGLQIIQEMQFPRFDNCTVITWEHLILMKYPEVLKSKRVGYLQPVLKWLRGKKE